MLDNRIEGTAIKIVIVASSLIALGMVMVSSSSMAFSDHDFNSVFHHTAAHGLRIAIGLLLALLVYVIGILRLKRFSLVLLLLGLILSFMIFIPGLSVDVNGATRWLRLGPVVFQPYDMFKLGYILFYAYVLDMYHKSGDSEGLFISYAVLCVASFVLLMQPDFGSLSLLIGVAMLTIFVVSGVTRYFLYAAILVVLASAWLIISEPYRIERVVMLFDPWSDRYGAGFQLIQALVAEGSGGVSGVGLGKSVQKMLYLPEAHTDFTISVFAEEMGLLGVMLTMLLTIYLYTLLMGLSLRLRNNDQYFECYVIFLVANFIFLQSLFNVGVNYGMFPTKGITLPFMGYGGTSIVSHIAMIGMVLASVRSADGSVPIRNKFLSPTSRSSIIMVS